MKWVVKFQWAEKCCSDPFQDGTGFKSQELHLALLFELCHEVFLGWLDVGMHKLEKQREELLSAVLWVRFSPRLIFTTAYLEEHRRVSGNDSFWEVLWCLWSFIPKSCSGINWVIFQPSVVFDDFGYMSGKLRLFPVPRCTTEWEWL